MPAAACDFRTESVTQFVKFQDAEDNSYQREETHRSITYSCDDKETQHCHTEHASQCPVESFRGGLPWLPEEIDCAPTIEHHGEAEEIEDDVADELPAVPLMTNKSEERARQVQECDEIQVSF